MSIQTYPGRHYIHGASKKGRGGSRHEGAHHMERKAILHTHLNSINQDSRSGKSRHKPEIPGGAPAHATLTLTLTLSGCARYTFSLRTCFD